MDTWLLGSWRALARIWNDLWFATASGAVEAVRYQPRRLLLTGGSQLAALPVDAAPLAVGAVSRELDDIGERLATRVGSRLGPGAGALARWIFGATRGLLDQVGASALDELRFRDRLGPGTLEPHLHTVGVVVLDMRGFSKLTVALGDSRHLTERINEYLSVMTRVIEDQRGVVFDYTGDGLLAVFLPELVRKKDRELIDHLAVTVTGELHGAFRVLRTRWSAEWQESGRREVAVGLGVGITHGPATIGLMGPEGKRYFGVVGPPVNLAAFLCSQAAGGTTLVDEEAFTATGATPPDGGRRIRLRSKKLHQRIGAVRLQPPP